MTEVPSTTATEPPWTPRGLWWRSTWPSIVVALAAFQAGVLVTLAVVWGRLDEPRMAPPPVAAPPAAPISEVLPIIGSTDAPDAPASPANAPAAAPAPAPTASVPPTPRPAPRTAALVEVQIISNPEGATVKLGGVVWGVTPLTAFLPDNQPAIIDLELAGHTRARTRWTPKLGGSREVRVELSPSEHHP